MESEQELRDLIAELSSRVDAIEGRAAQAPADPAADPQDPLWILNGLKQRIDDPGAVVFAGAVRVAAGPIEWQVGFPVDTILASDWSSLSANLASLGNPVRLALLQAVINGATSVAELSAGEGMGTTGQLYHHLNLLVAQNWLHQAGRGHYSIPPERVVPLLVILSAARRTM